MVHVISIFSPSSFVSLIEKRNANAANMEMAAQPFFDAPADVVVKDELLLPTTNDEIKQDA